MGRAGDDRHFADAGEVLIGVAVELENGFVLLADNQQGGGLDFGEMFVNQVRSPASGDDGADLVTQNGGGPESRRAAGAGTKETKPRMVRSRMAPDPMSRRDQSVGKKINIEAVAAIGQIIRFLIICEKVQQHRSEPCLDQFGSHKLVPLAVSAAPAPMREENDPFGLGGHDPSGFEFLGIDRNLNDSRKAVLGLVQSRLFF